MGIYVTEERNSYDCSPLSSNRRKPTNARHRSIDGSAIRRGTSTLQYHPPKTFHCLLSSSQQLPSPAKISRPAVQLYTLHLTGPSHQPNTLRLLIPTSSVLTTPNREESLDTSLTTISYNAHRHRVPYDQLQRFFVLHVYAKPARNYRTAPRIMGLV